MGGAQKCNFLGEVVAATTIFPYGIALWIFNDYLQAFPKTSLNQIYSRTQLSSITFYIASLGLG